MKTSKIMLAFLGTVILTWLIISTLVYLCTGDISYREACTHNGVLFVMLIFGWVPSVIVSSDLDEHLA